MTSAFRRLLDYANAAMSNNLHNYGGAGSLALTLFIGVTIVVNWLVNSVDPGDGILTLFLYAAGLYCTTQGLAGGLHTYKALRGATGMNTPPGPQADSPAPRPAGEEG